MTYLIHHVLDDAAERYPDRVALRFKGRSMTYRELRAHANGVARTLADAGVQVHDRVGILVPKGFEQVAAVYGALKAGACFVPLDPLAPPARVAEMVRDSTPSAIVATPARAAELAEELEADLPRAFVLVDDGTGPVDLPVPAIAYAEATRDPDATAPDVHVVELDLCLIAYTSGSTGAPKGVMHNHHSIDVASAWFASEVGLRTDDVMAMHMALHFLMSPYILCSAPRVGATVVIMGEDETGWGTEIVRVIREERVSVWFSVSPAITLMVQGGAEPGSLPSLRFVAFGGAAFPRKDLEALKSLVPDAELMQVLGTTETLCITTYHFRELPPDDGQPLPVGPEISIGNAILLKEDGTRAGPGEEGEVFFRTPTLMRGYWKRPDLTAAALVPNPLDDTNPDLVYRSGDVVRLGEDGNHVFVGRRDNQVKTRGYRVELEEVERCILAHRLVRQAIVVALPHPEWVNVVGASVVPEPGASIDAADVKAHVADRLPAYMVPAEVRVVSELPTTSSGKVDRPRIRDEMAREAAAG